MKNINIAFSLLTFSKLQAITIRFGVLSLVWLITFLLFASTSYSQTISPYLAGQNAWLPKAYGGINYGGQLNTLWPTIKKSGVKMVRIGGNGVNYNQPTADEYVALIDSIRKIGAEPMVEVGEGRGKYSAAQAATIVDYVNNIKGRHIKYWIIGNEPDLTQTAPTINAAGVAAYTKAFSSAMKLKDPTILIVGPECSYYNSNYYPALIGGANDVTGKDANGNYYVDVVSFHSYPFSGTQTRDQVIASAAGLSGNVDKLIALMNAANTKNGRTGINTLKWALTEFNVNYNNPTSNTVEGVGSHSFLNGQYWAQVFGVAMQKSGLSVQPWCVQESGGARTAKDEGYLDGSGSSIKPRSSYYHEMLMSENLRGAFIKPTDNQSAIFAYGSTFNDTTSIMVLNTHLTDDYDFTLQLSDKIIADNSSLKINLPVAIDVAYKDKIYAQSTLVFLFDKQGNLIRKIVYSLLHNSKSLAPSYLKPGQNITLTSFSADKKVICIDQDKIVFTSLILGKADELTWNFGQGANPQTATGKGPFTVSYASSGSKSVSFTLKNADTTIVDNKPNYIQAQTCTFAPQPFVAGNLVVYRYGDGSAAMPNSAVVPVFLDEYTSEGTLVKSRAIPAINIGSNLRVTGLGKLNTGLYQQEGMSTLSQDGKYLAVFGYNQAIGGGVPTTSDGLVVGVFSADGTYNSTTTLSNTSASGLGAPRSAIVNNTNEIYANGFSPVGVQYTTIGAKSTSTRVNAANVQNSPRTMGIFNNTLYVPIGSSGTLAQASPPPTATTTFSTNAYPVSVYSNQVAVFTVANTTIMYVADDNAFSIRRYYLDGTNWVALGTVINSSPLIDYLKGITGVATVGDGNTIIRLYATTWGNNGSGTEPSKLLTFTDTYDNLNPTFAPLTTDLIKLATAPTNTVFRSVTVAPEDSTINGTSGLPVKLVSFTGKKQINGVELSWRTASENNNSHFDILRSADGKKFQTIGKTDGKGNSNRPVNYSFVDHNAVYGTNYYQLKQVDYNGEFDYSKIISVAFSQQTKDWQVYPNPAGKITSNFNIKLNTDLEFVKIKLMDVSGKLLLEKKESSVRNGQQIMVNKEFLGKGVYVLQVITNKNTRTVELVVE